MWFGVLGPLVVGRTGADAPVTGPAVRRLLAVLLAHHGRVVPVPELVAGIWGEHPPASAEKTLQSHVLRLRRTLGDAAAVARAGCGYRVVLTDGDVDAEQFETLLTQARAAASTEPSRAAALLDRGLALWRGAAYADVRDAPATAAEAARLEALRALALELRSQARLDMGDGAELVPELESLVAADPLRERLWVQLVTALYRSGRQADALAAYGKARALLADELGVDPGPELRHVHQAVLRQSPALLRASTPPAPLPSTLAADRRPLVGREADLAALAGAWSDSASRGMMAVLLGPGGSGRSRLAAEFARALHERGVPVVDESSQLPPHGPALAVLDDVEAARVTALARAAPRPGVLVVAIPATGGDDGLTTSDRVRRIRLAALDSAGVTAVAEQYADAEHVDSLVEALEPAGGLPGRLHPIAAAWREDRAREQVAAAAERIAAARRDLADAGERVAAGVLRLQSATLSPRRAALEPSCPWRGLAAYTEAEADWYVGRERLVAEVVGRLVDSALVSVVGPSGSGKSSLVRAGVLPSLARGVLPGSDQWSVVDVRARPPLAGAVRSARRRLAESSAPGLLVIDAAEALVAPGQDAADQADAVSELEAALTEEGGRVLLVTRADVYARWAAFPDLARRIAAEQTVVTAPAPDELRRVVLEPAARAGLAVENRLVDAAVAEVAGRPGALPLLSAALRSTWERREDRTLTWAAYLSAGGVGGAVAQLGESAWTQLDDAGRPAARRVLSRLVDSDADGTLVRRGLPRAELIAPGDEAAGAAVDVLVTKRLLTEVDGQVELTHEAVLTAWPRLRGWLDDDTEGRRRLRRLGSAAATWFEGGEDPRDLAHGERLRALEHAAAARPAEVSASERRFLDASQAARADAEASERAAAVAARRSRRLRRVAVAVVAAAVVLAVVGAGIATVERGRAEDASRSADARRLGALAVAEPALDRALLLAVAGYRLDDSAETRSALQTVLVRAAGVHHVMRARSRVNSVAIAPDASVVVSGTNDGAIEVRDAATGRHVARADVGGQVAGLAVSADGGAVVAAVGGQAPRLAELALEGSALEVRRRMPLPPAQVTDIALSPDQDTVAVALDASGTRLIGIETGRVLNIPFRSRGVGWTADGLLVTAGDGVHVVEADSGRLVAAHDVGDSAAVAAVGDRVAVGTWDGRTLLIDPGVPGSELVVERDAAPAVAAATSRDGSAVALTHGDGAVVVRDETGTALARAAPHRAPVVDVAFSGSVVATASLDGTTATVAADGRVPGRWSRSTRVPAPEVVAVSPRGDWAALGGRGGVEVLSVEDGAPRGPVAGVDHDVAAGVAFAGEDELVVATATTSAQPGGRLLVVGLRDAESKVRLLADLPTPARDVSVSPDGRRAAVASDTRGVLIWDLGDERLIRTDLVHAVHLAMSAWSPDGRRLAVSSSASPDVAVWDLDGGDRLGTLETGDGWVESVAWSSDGRRLLTAGSEHGTLSVWNVAERRRDLLMRTTSGWTLAADWSPDEEIVVAAGSDGGVRLFDAAGTPLGVRLPGGDGAARARFTALGDVLAVWEDGTVAAFPGTPERWTAAACAVAGRALSDGEWREAMPDRSPIGTC